MWGCAVIYLKSFGLMISVLIVFGIYLWLIQVLPSIVGLIVALLPLFGFIYLACYHHLKEKSK